MKFYNFKSNLILVILLVISKVYVSNFISDQIQKYWRNQEISWGFFWKTENQKGKFRNRYKPDGASSE